jgi:hypothetical protein
MQLDAISPLRYTCAIQQLRSAWRAGETYCPATLVIRLYPTLILILPGPMEQRLFLVEGCFTTRTLSRFRTFRAKPTGPAYISRVIGEITSDIRHLAGVDGDAPDAPSRS